MNNNIVKQIWIGIIITLTFLLLHLLLSDSYGLTWDFHHIFFAGLKFIGHPLTGDLVANIPFGKPSPWDMFDVPFGQIMPMLSALGYVWFYEKLHILPFDTAFHLSTIVLGSLGILILYLFLLESYGFRIALLGALFLALYPRYFADTQNNIKDTPQAVVFALAVWLFWRFVNFRKITDLLLASLVFALGFNIKINSVFILVVAFVWIIWLIATKSGAKLHIALSALPLKKIYPILIYFPLAIILALLGWIISWQNPIQELLYIPKFFQENTKNLEALYFGKWYCSTVNIPWHYPLGYLAIVTPLPILLFSVFGLVVLVKQTIQRTKPASALIILWFFVPISRFVLPNMGVLDGIRHFLEVVYPLSAMATVGFVTFLNSLNRFRIKKLNLIISGILIIYLCVINFIYHPYQIAYFNSLVGGIKGAWGKFDIDYWGTSQKQAAIWLNENAPKDSVVYVFMVPDIVAKYLRPDLRARLNTTDFDHARYVVVLNRQSFFYRYFYSWEYFLRRKTIYVVTNQGVPLTWIYDNQLGKTDRRDPWWKGESPCIQKYW